MISKSRSDGVCVVTLDRADKRNALSLQMLREIIGICESVDSDGIRVLVLESVDQDWFSSGFDLDDISKYGIGPVQDVLYRAVEALYATPCPVLARVAGGCFGAALSVVLAADVRVAAANAHFRFPVAAIAGGYPPETLGRMSEALGSSRATYLALTGGPLSSADALAAGIVHEVFSSPEQARSRTDELSEAMTSRLWPDSLRYMKSAIRGGAPAQGAPHSEIRVALNSLNSGDEFIARTQRS